MKFACPKCKQIFEGKPNFCPHCGAKLNWPKEEAPAAPAQKQVVKEPAPEAPQRPAPQRPVEDPYAYSPAPRQKAYDDDEPYYAAPQANRGPRQKVYALPFKILMMAFSGMTGLFALICLLTYIGDFISYTYGGSTTGFSGYKVAFNFTNSIGAPSGGLFVGPLVGFLVVLAVIGLSIPRIINDIKFFKAKPNTMMVARRKQKAILWIILIPSILLVGLIFVFLTNIFAGMGDWSNISLGGGAIATAIFMIFMITFVAAEEIIVMAALRLQPRY